MSEISSLTGLKTVYPEPHAIAARKELGHIDAQARAFIARSSFVVSRPPTRTGGRMPRRAAIRPAS